MPLPFIDPYPYHHDDHYSIRICDVGGNIVVVTITANPIVVEAWILGMCLYYIIDLITAWKRYLIVGLGVQWTPSRGRFDWNWFPDDRENFQWIPHNLNPPADTLQLCIGPHCLIFRLSHAPTVPLILRYFLRSPFVIFVGFYNGLDWSKLYISRHRLGLFRHPLDLRYLRDWDGWNLLHESVNTIISRCLNYEVNQSREVCMSRWNDAILTDDQIIFACVDAFCAFTLARNFFHPLP